MDRRWPACISLSHSFQIISQIAAKLFDFICDLIFCIIYLLRQHLASVIDLLTNVLDCFVHAFDIITRTLDLVPDAFCVFNAVGSWAGERKITESYWAPLVMLVLRSVARRSRWHTKLPNM